MSARAAALTGLGLFLLVFFTHGLSRNATPFDSVWTVPVILSILGEGDTDLDEFRPYVASLDFYAIQCVTRDSGVFRPSKTRPCPADAHLHNHYPEGVSMMALPAFLLVDAGVRVAGPVILATPGGFLTPMMRRFFERAYLETSPVVEVVLASFFVGLTTVLVWLTSRRYLPDRLAAAIALLFAFGTPAWSTYSRALYQHAPLALMLAAALFLLSRGDAKPGWLAWTAVPLVAGYFIRPTGTLPLAAIGAWIGLHRRDRLLKWAGLAAATALPFVLYNFAVYRMPLAPYYARQQFLPLTPASIDDFLERFAGQAISPNRGLIVFCPFLLFAVWGLWRAHKDRWHTPLVYYLAAAVLGHWGVISLYEDWIGGHAYGPRFFSDPLVILFFFLIPAVARLRAARARAPAAVFAALALLSVGIHARGALTYDVYIWNLKPVDINFDWSRPWDWRDLQMLRGLGGPPEGPPPARRRP
jgi:hypothetical protein